MIVVKLKSCKVEMLKACCYFLLFPPLFSHWVIKLLVIGRMPKGKELDICLN